MAKKWITFFSQSGSEIYNLINELDRIPDTIVTNKSEEDCKDLPLYKEHSDKFVFLPKNPAAKDYDKIFKKVTVSYDLVTLHGYLRIIPKKWCSKFFMYNLHPGLITRYPELKGKDPQVRAFKKGHTTMGCVIHKVIPEVDEGAILEEGVVKVKGRNIDEVFCDLAELALILWTEFIPRYL